MSNNALYDPWEDESMYELEDKLEYTDSIIAFYNRPGWQEYQELQWNRFNNSGLKGIASLRDYQNLVFLATEGLLDISDSAVGRIEDTLPVDRVERDLARALKLIAILSRAHGIDMASLAMY